MTIKEKQIAPVSSNTEKAKTYRTMIGNYDRAMRYGFCFEALMISYSMIEDRLKSILYHIGALNSRQSTTVDSKKIKRYLLEIYNRASGNSSSYIKISNISTKYVLIRALVQWAATEEGVPENDKYMEKIKTALCGVDFDELTDCFLHLEHWCGFRNEAVHSLMNKNMESLQSQIAVKAEEGMLLARQIDKFVDAVKKGNRLRHLMNLPIEK